MGSSEVPVGPTPSSDQPFSSAYSPFLLNLLLVSICPCCVYSDFPSSHMLHTGSRTSSCAAHTHTQWQTAREKEEGHIVGTLPPWLVTVWTLEPCLQGIAYGSPEMRWAWVVSAFPYNSTVSADCCLHAPWTPDCLLLPRSRPVPAMIWRCPSLSGRDGRGPVHDGRSL